MFVHLKSDLCYSFDNNEKREIKKQKNKLRWLSHLHTADQTQVALVGGYRSCWTQSLLTWVWIGVSSTWPPQRGG